MEMDKQWSEQGDRVDMGNNPTRFQLPTTKRTLLILFGWLLGYLGSRYFSFPYFVTAMIMGMCMTLWGCYLWAVKIKNRHWAFMFWGLMSPIGLLGISLLENKNNASTH